MKKGYPSQINTLFYQKKVDGAFISSVKSENCDCLDFGIAAYKKVKSVLVIPGEPKKDSASATSNVLAEVLGVSGEVIIGDRALYTYYRRESRDLATLWHEKERLPFVFARFCCTRHAKRFKKILDRFGREKSPIPYYVLEKKAKEKGITTAQLRDYFTIIYYALSHKEKRALKRFFKLKKRKYAH